MNKNIIIAILIILIVAVVGFTLFQPHATTTEDGKLNTQLNFLSGTSIKNGDTVQFELKDATGAAISDASVKITYVHDGTTEKYSIITNSEGKGYLVISGEDAGSYDITVDYSGNEKYNACTAKQTIKIEKESSGTAKTEARQEQTESNSTANTVKYNDVDTSSKQTSNSSSSTDSSSSDGYNPNKEYVSQLYYDEEYGVYYDDFGTIHGGPFDGGEIALLKDPNATSLNYFEEENYV